MADTFIMLADWLVYGLLGLDRQTHFAGVAHFFVEDTAKIFFLLTTLMFLAGFIRSWISPEKVRRWLQGKPKGLAYFLAVTLGAITPFCSCSSIPLFISFLGSGIPFGVTMAFLITSPMVSEVGAVLFGEAIGWHFTLAYVGIGMATGMVGGALIDRMKLEKWVEPFVIRVNVPVDGAEGTKPAIRQRFDRAWNETRDILKRVWPYVLIGVGIGAVIHGYVPQEWIAGNLGADNLLAVPLAVIAAVPLYSNVTGVVPVAEVLIDKGLPVGTTLAFVMSTVAISLPELVILRKVLKLEMLALFVAWLVVAFIATGYVFNALF